MKLKRNRYTSDARPGMVTYLVLGFILVLSVFPFYWSFLIGSGDSSTYYDTDIDWLPQGNFLENASKVVNDAAVGFWGALYNSIVVATITAISVVIFSTLAGFAFSKLNFKGSAMLLAFVIGTMAVPVQLGVVPLYLVMVELQWVDTLQAIILPGMVTAFGVFWMTQYLRQALPYELIEAARVDGASLFRTFWSVALPAARPAAFMLFLFTFITSWTTFLWPFIVAKNEPTLPVALSLLQSNYFVDYSIVLAGALLSTIPLVILFIFTGRQLVSGIMAGAVKG